MIRTASEPAARPLDAAPPPAPPALLDVSLTADYPGRPSAVRAVRFSLQPGEILALIGQSGSGKSTVATAILGLLPFRGGRAHGAIRYQGRELLSLSERQWRQFRGKEIGFVPQSPLAALNPSLRLEGHFQEAWRAHSPDRHGWRHCLPGLLERVQLPTDSAFLRQYPHQLSVGLAQRVLIALALLHQPPLILADEPTSALDAITQAAILQLFAALNRDLSTAILFISHDLLSVARLSHRVAILCKGELIEQGTAAEVFHHPQQPYTRQLIGALPPNVLP